MSRMQADPDELARRKFAARGEAEEKLPTNLPSGQLAERLDLSATFCLETIMRRF